MNISEAFDYYIKNHCARLCQDVSRIAAVQRLICEHFGVECDPTTLKRADFRGYEDFRYATGVSKPTVRRELTMLQAALNFCVAEEVLPACPKIQKPSAEGRKRRALTEDEFRKVMAQKLDFRTEMFFWMAYWTGARSRAIETLTWDRVHWDKLTIDFNVPGARRHNKRRVDGFPIPQGLLPILKTAYKRHQGEWPDDPYVLTRGTPRKNEVATTYHGCKDALRAVGIDELGVCRHTLRKTFVTVRLTDGQPPALVADLIGDKVDTMMEHYKDVLTADLRRVVNRESRA